MLAQALVIPVVATASPSGAVVVVVVGAMPDVVVLGVAMMLGCALGPRLWGLHGTWKVSAA